MYVYYTVDTEFWPRHPRQPDFARAADDFQRDVLGVARGGEYGIRYQMDALEAEGLKGVFFIEALHALKLGGAYLRDMVQMVQGRGHEAALHLHPEWLAWMDRHPLAVENTQHLHALPIAQQRWLVRSAVRLMTECGVSKICSFRAGNYGADRQTLQALAAEGIAFDSSYNIGFLGHQCRLQAEAPMIFPQRIEGVTEVPISFIQDYPGHYRPMQIMAVSFDELRAALENASHRAFPSFVVVSHSFELIRRQGHRTDADSIVRRRFDDFVGYLGRNKERYQVMTFADTAHETILRRGGDEPPLKGSVWRTTSRVCGQLIRRALARGYQ